MNPVHFSSRINLTTMEGRLAASAAAAKLLATKTVTSFPSEKRMNEIFHVTRLMTEHYCSGKKFVDTVLRTELFERAYASIQGDTNEANNLLDKLRIIESHLCDNVSMNWTATNLKSILETGLYYFRDMDNILSNSVAKNSVDKKSESSDHNAKVDVPSHTSLSPGITGGLKQLKLTESTDSPHKSNKSNVGISAINKITPAKHPHDKQKETSNVLLKDEKKLRV